MAGTISLIYLRRSHVFWLLLGNEIWGPVGTEARSFRDHDMALVFRV